MFDIWTLVLVMPAIGFSFLVRQRCMSTLKRYSQVAAKSGQTGQQVADRMLELNNLSGGTVPIRAVQGAWSDHFARGKKAQNGKVAQWIGLSEPVHGVASISATAVAAHEVGHAIQFNSGYKLMKLRTAIRPVSTFGSRFGPWVASMGIMFGFGPLLNIGIVLFSGAVLFSLLTL
ncbi:MAG: zinc metallopeptidase, partial [Treponema sp.]|nr:zinc metallopeptidase [Treponema sp.]